MGTVAVIDAAKAALTPTFIANAAGDFAATNGVFFNPATTSPYSATLPNSIIGVSTAYSPANRQLDVPNSIGQAIYYERD